MNTEAACTPDKITAARHGAAAEIAGFIRKIVRALTFNADGIFKSKDWPYLWPK